MWKRRFLIALCLLLGIRGGGVAWTVITQLDLYREVHTAGVWWLRALLNALWGVSFLALAGGLWRRQRWAIRALMPMLTGYALFSVIWLALYVQSDYDRQRIESVGVTSVLGLGLIFLVVWRTKNDY